MTEFTSCEDCVHNNSGNDCYCNKCIYSELQDNFKPKKIELEAGCYHFSIEGEVKVASSFNEFIKCGSMRNLVNSAELAAKRMLRVNRLSALAAQLGGEKEFVEGENNYLLIRRTNKNEHYWYVEYTQVSNEPEKVYMTKEVAEQICDILNKGLFDLNGGE